MSPTTGGSSSPVIVNVAVSLSDNAPVSVAMNLITSTPFQFSSGGVMFAIRFVISTTKSQSPSSVYVQTIAESASSGFHDEELQHGL